MKSSKLKTIALCIVVLLVCTGVVAWAQYRERNKLIPVSVDLVDQTGPDTVVLSFYVDRQFGGQPGGSYCCVMLPKYWKPGLTFELYWDYTEQSKGSPPPQKMRVEVEEYKPDRLGLLHIHVYPNHRVRAIANNRGFGSPFYPLPKEEWVNWGIDQTLLARWKGGYYEMIKGSTFIPDDEDWKWAAQWGLIKEEELAKIDNSSKQEIQQ